MTTEQQPAEPVVGTIRFIGVRASFKKAEELLTRVLEEDQAELRRAISPELREETEAFLAQFKAADA